MVDAHSDLAERQVPCDASLLDGDEAKCGHACKGVDDADARCHERTCATCGSRLLAATLHGGR